MRRVPEICKPVAPPRLSPQDDTYHLAVCGLGTRHDGQVQESQVRIQIPTGCSRQIHQVDRSQTSQKRRQRLTSSENSSTDSAIHIASSLTTAQISQRERWKNSARKKGFDS